MPGSSIRLTARDRRLLSELQTLRVIDREQAQTLGPFGSIPRANARLLALTRAGYLARAFLGSVAGGRKAVYFLPGSRLATRRGPQAHQEAFAHQLAVNRVYLAFQARAYGVSLLEWRRFEELLAPDVPLIPDGLVHIDTASGPISMFVEVDRGTESVAIWTKKIALYLHLATSGAFREIIGEERFRVLVIADCRRRRDRIAREISRQTEKVFWLSTDQDVEKYTPWGPIWIRPGASIGQRLIE